ncbi:MAG: hypothetical protein JW734_07480 [Candidatus Omnitrophica bacterium]|nr:hypothetical protein [Candidatus Omnitrophota bacterium]
MVKQILALLAVSFLLLVNTTGFTQGDPTAKETLNGTLTEIAEDGSYIMLDGTKILVSQDFLDGFYLEVGDKAEIIAERTDQGLQAIDYDYAFDDDDTVYEMEKDLTSEQKSSTKEEPTTDIEDNDSY